MKFRIRNFYFLTVVFIFSFLFFNSCQAVILYLEPFTGQYPVGDIFMVEVRLNTEEEFINTTEVNLIFSQDILAMEDFSKGNSILNLWVGEPGFSNQSGIVSFAGGTPGGYQGEGGLLGKVVFRAKEQGKAKIWFQEDSQVLLNDGLGTKAHLIVQGAYFDIVAKESEVSRDEWNEVIQEDNIAPESFEIEVQRESAIFEGKYFIIFSTTDKQTGIDYWEVQEGEKEWKRAVSPYLLEDQFLRDIIRVKVVDKAGNERLEEYHPRILKRLSLYWLISLIVLVLAVGGGWLVYRKRRSVHQGSAELIKTNKGFKNDDKSP